MIVTLARPAMGTRFELALCGEGPVFLRAAGEEALDEVERLEAQLSRFRPDSELSGINARAADAPVVVEPRLFALLQRIDRLWAATAGAFDPTVGALMCELEAASLTSPPDPMGVNLTPQPPSLKGRGSLGSGAVAAGSPFPASAASELGKGAGGVRLTPIGAAGGVSTASGNTIGWQHVVLDPSARTIRFSRPGMSLDLGAIGKGYALERACGLLREAGVESALMHAGTSSVVALGAPPEAEGWVVAIRDPRSPERHLARARLRDRALSVSAPHGKWLTIHGERRGHVLDPRSGRSVSDALLAALVTDSPTDGDALSTALLALGRGGLSLIARYDPGCRGLLAVAAADGSGDPGGMEVSLLGSTSEELCCAPGDE